jgi:phenylacetate-CoA ligase
VSQATFPDRKEVQEVQLKQLNQVLSECLNSESFYTPRLRQDGIGGPVKSVSEFQEKCRVTTKQELVEDQDLFPPYGRKLTLPADEYTRFNQTSGTTGMPLRWPDTSKGWAWMLANWSEILRNSGVSRADRIMFTFSFGPFIGFWLAFEAAQSLDCMCFPGGGLSSSARLAMMFDNRVNVLCCTPTYALHLAEIADKKGFDIKSLTLKKLIVAGEPGASIPATRQKIEAAWGKGCVADHHGMTEVGPVSYECPSSAGVLHIIESAYLPEVVDTETLQAVSPGTEGELVLTALGRIGCPVLRYRTGDRVKTASNPKCACGRVDMALEGGILGRTDDMLVVRGVNIHPSAVEEVVRSQENIVEYRVEVNRRNTLPQISIQIETCREGDVEKTCELLAEKLQKMFSLRIPVTAVRQGQLPRFEMKAQRWVMN